MLHEQAIYQHDGRQYQVERLDFDNRKAYVQRINPDYFTTAQTHTNITVTQCDESEMCAHISDSSHWVTVIFVCVCAVVK